MPYSLTIEFKGDEKIIKNGIKSFAKLHGWKTVVQDPRSHPDEKATFSENPQTPEEFAVAHIKKEAIADIREYMKEQALKVARKQAGVNFKNLSADIY